MIIADAGYRTPAIARRLLLDGIEPLFPYKPPMTKEGYFRKHDYVYDEYYDCYIYGIYRPLSQTPHDEKSA